MQYLATIAKAVVAFIAPGAAILISSVLESSAGGTAITTGEWVTAGCTAVVTAAAVYQVRNAAAVPVMNSAPEHSL